MTKKRNRRLRRNIITSKLKLALKAGTYEEFEEDDIYVKPCKKAHLAIWSSQLSAECDSLEGGENPIIIEILEIYLIKLILLSACYEDGEKLGLVNSEEDIDLFRELQYPLLRDLFRASYDINRLPKGQGDKLLEVFENLENIEDADFEEVEEPKPKAKKTQKK